jgi:hypothetical protein
MLTFLFYFFFFFLPFPLSIFGANGSISGTPVKLSSYYLPEGMILDAFPNFTFPDGTFSSFCSSSSSSTTRPRLIYRPSY